VAPLIAALCHDREDENEMETRRKTEARRAKTKPPKRYTAN